jgi:ribonuclease PH
MLQTLPRLAQQKEVHHAKPAVSNAHVTGACSTLVDAVGVVKHVITCCSLVRAALSKTLRQDPEQAWRADFSRH